MAKQITISDAAYAVIRAHAQANRETFLEAIDELVGYGAPHTWELRMPEMISPMREFKNYYPEVTGI